jgi:hypothetical protein
VESLERRDTPTAFTAGDLVVYRVDGGAAAISANGNAVHLDEFQPTGSAQIPVQTIDMATSGTNAFVAGNSTLEGGITLSPDSQYLTLTGFNITLPGSGTTTASTADRLIAVADKSGTVTIHNRLTDLAGNAPRGSVTVDSNGIWVSGNTGANWRYAANNGDTTSTQVATAPPTPRFLQIAGGQLYGSAQSGAFRIFTIGTGLPTGAGNTTTNLPGAAIAALANPEQFFFADLSPSIPGVDTLYVADNTSGTAGGVFKFSFDGTNWNANGHLQITLTGGNPLGLIGSASGGNVTIFGTNASTLFTFTDTSGYGGTINGTPSSLATAPTNNAFRGVAFAPGAATSATVTSLVANTGSTTGPSVTYTETFSAAVSGLAATNFTLTNTGTATGVIGTPSTSNGGLTWTIPVNSIGGLGTIRLDDVNSTGVTPPVSNLPFDGSVVNVTAPGSTLDVSSGQAIFSAGLNQVNNVTLSVSGGTYSINDTLQTITLTANAVSAGWSGSGTNTVTGPDSATNSLLIAMGTGADTFTLNGVNDPLTVTSNGDAGSTANFPVSVSLAGAVSITGFDSFNQSFGTVLAISNLTLGGNTVGSLASPIHTQADSITANGAAGGINLLEDDGASFTLAATGAGPINVVNTAGTLTIGGASTFGSGPVSLSSGDGIAINAALGDLNSSGTVSIAANTDGAGNQGFTMSSSGSIRTLDASGAAFSLTVNTASGGTGDALVNTIQTGTMGTVAINANGGSILGTATNTISAGGGTTGFPGTITLTTSGASSAVGTAAQHLILKTGNLSASAGTGGIYLEEASDQDCKVGNLTAQGAGNIFLLATNGSNNGFQFAGLVNTGSGNITLQTDDSLQILFTGGIGDTNFSGKIECDVNLDGQNQQTYLQAAGTQVQTTNNAPDAVVINVSASTNSTAAGGATLGNIKVGAGGGITVNCDKLLGNSTDSSRAGFIEMVDNMSLLDTGSNGTVTLIAKDNYIGTSSTPILATCGSISANTNSTASTTLATQQDAKIFVKTTGPANFSGSTTDAGTHIGDITFTTMTGGITLNGNVKTDTGAINLNSAAGIDQTAGAVTTLGTATYSYTGLVRFSTAGNSIATLSLSSGQNLRVDGGVTLVNPITIDGTLSGAGTLSASVNVAATGSVSPGDSPGKLGVGNTTFVSGSQFIVELNGNNAGVDYDQLAVTGAIDITGAKLVASVGGTITPGSTLTIIDNDTTSDPVVGTFVDSSNNAISEGGTVAVGGINFTISYKGGDGNDVTLTAPGSATPPPTVANLKIGDGTVQRSMVSSLTVTFSEAVTFTGPIANAFLLSRDSAPPAGPGTEQGGVTGLVNLSAAQVGNVVTLTFNTSGSNPVNAVGGAGNLSLPDGRYTLNIDASQVMGVGGKLDGNGDGTGGDNYVLASAAAPAQATNIFRFFGDVTGDGAVSAADFNGNASIVGFRQAFGGTDPRLDYNNDGSVAASDFTQFRFRFGGTVP